MGNGIIAVDVDGNPISRGDTVDILEGIHVGMPGIVTGNVDEQKFVAVRLGCGVSVWLPGVSLRFKLSGEPTLLTQEG